MDGSHAAVETRLRHPRFPGLTRLEVWRRALQVVVETKASLISGGFGDVCAGRMLKRKNEVGGLLGVDRL